MDFKQAALVASFPQRNRLLESAHPMTATTEQRLGVSVLRIRLGAALQKQRLNRGLTQAQLAEFADLSLKYVGEIERGEANTSLEVLERLSIAVGWDPVEDLESIREPLSEGVRMLLLDEVTQMVDRLRTMIRWLQALDPAFYIKAPKQSTEKSAEAQAQHGRLKGARPRRSRRAAQEAASEPAKEPEDDRTAFLDS